MRIAFNITLIISALFFPWWLCVPLMLAACFLVPHFYEVAIYGMLIDSLYATPSGFHGFPFVWSAFAVLAFVTATAIRSRVSW
ncbi:MAG: hypothetical protein WC763_00785 [Candidatus Paceibacterota bacterium]|jgi:phosphatidylserine synthase